MKRYTSLTMMFSMAARRNVCRVLQCCVGRWAVVSWCQALVRWMPSYLLLS